jgi:hypothetical protein
VATSGTVTLCGPSYNVSGSPYPTGAAANWAGDLSYAASSGSNSLTVSKANATFTVTPYNVAFDGNPHTATVGTITGVCGETGATVGTVDVTGTTHTAAGDYPTDPWTFNPTGNYNGQSGTVHDHISSIIVQRGVATTANNNNTGSQSTITINKPTGVVTGDVMIANITQHGGTATNFATLAGWTNVATPVAFEPGGSHHRCALLYRVATSADNSVTQYVFNLGDNNLNVAGAIVAFANVNTSTPFDVTPGTYSTNTVNSDISGVTQISTVTANAAVLMFAAANESTAITSFSTTTSPGALTSLYGNVTNGNGAVGAGWNLKAAAGLTGAGSALNTPDSRWAAILVALKPAF